MSFKTINIIHSKNFLFPKPFKVTVNHWNLTPNVSFKKTDDENIDSCYNNMSSFINNSRNNNSIIKQNFINNNKNNINNINNYNNSDKKIFCLKKNLSQSNSMRQILYEKGKNILKFLLILIINKK